MIEILYFQQNKTFGLTERYLLDLARGIDRSRYHVHLMFPEVSELLPFEQLDSDGVCLHGLPANLVTGNVVHLVPKLLNAFSNLNPDLIHFNDPVVAGMLAGRLQQHAVLAMTHHTPELNRQYNWRGQLFERIALGGRPFVIFTSENDRLTGIKRDGIRSEDSAVVPYGINVPSFNGDFDRQSICDELGVSPTHRIVGNVARLVPQKGHDYLLAAAGIVLSNFEDVTFVVVGEGKLRDDLSAKVARAGLADRFVFTGQRADVPRILSIFDIFVMPSLFEGLCMAVLEAFAAGLPVVATSVGGVPSTVSEGETGILVPPSDANALADAILWMLGHPHERSEMGMMGKRRAEARFTVTTMLERTEAIYERLLSRPESEG